ncbi:aldehyde dehydrogenase domain-containing protein [Fusarium flagelliforme]|uniref:Aldehyde dehydrogenase n=1 Tax=Fusarium flagelliforme TaxID=2675880 RepID=A0A395MHP6_9HYPO|nr:aldehyde dehydrogenase domain-containing protein [Fusarium flagelliforme]KAH7196701.1 aldehyde dehydrogenase domain-containing protein [Fusarium flagelliforme]RFN47356.1 aldehyde dehydrogenase [Fusarium flagelliforme]
MSTKLHTVPFLIGGSDQVSERAIDVVSPRSGEVVHRYSSADVKDANAAVDAAAEAFKSWRKTRPAERRDLLLKAAEIMERRQDELREYAMSECGSDAAWANFDISTGISHIKEVAGRVGTLEGAIPTVSDPNTTALVLREPYGVVVAIAPWNAPYILGTRSVLFPIAAGNTVVFKASEVSPRTLWAIADVFREAGFPDGVLNVIFHERATAAAVTTALIEHPQVKKINFTGSTPVGRIIGKLAGENLKPVILELGGKAPAIVWEDADLDLAALQCTLGSFMNSGQVCMATERILVHKNVKAEFEKKLSATIEQIFSSGADAPILIASAPVEKNKALIKDAISKGASLVHGNVDAEETSKTRMRPIVIKDVTTEMDIYQTESFGPTVSLISIETEEEAIKIANDTEYGLSSAVFTSDLQRGLRIAREIESGAVHINNMSIHDESGLPHGGAKSSGYGRFGASAGLEEWTRTKNITFKN